MVSIEYEPYFDLGVFTDHVLCLVVSLFLFIYKLEILISFSFCSDSYIIMYTVFIFKYDVYKYEKDQVTLKRGICLTQFNFKEIFIFLNESVFILRKIFFIYYFQYS